MERRTARAAIDHTEPRLDPPPPHVAAAVAEAVVAEPLVIDCETCAAQHTAACDDCVVALMCGIERASAVVIDVAEHRALRLLHEGGLVPRLRHQRGA